MPKFELTKSIECKRLNKRSKLPFAEHPAIIPYGALVDEIEEVGGAGRFVYLGELYECSHGLLQSALGKPESAPAAASSRSPVSGAAGLAPKIQWEELTSSLQRVWRAKVPGGWLIALGLGEGRAITFYPDATHAWDGTSLE